MKGAAVAVLLAVGLAVGAEGQRPAGTFPGAPQASCEELGRGAKLELPPSGPQWDKWAVERAQDCAPPFAFIPEWLEAAEGLCREPELGADARAIANWEPIRLRALLAWLQWTKARATSGQRAWVPPSPVKLALLHTAAVMSQVAARHPNPEFMHLEVAEALLSPVMGPGSVSSALRRSWFEVVPQWMLAYDRQDYALKRTQSGLREYPGHIPLLFFTGVLHDLTTSPLMDPMRFNTDEWRRRENEVARELRAAERAYRRVLEVEPAHAEARLRLGRVLERQGDARGAQAQYESALAASPRAEVEWLAHMFLGRVLLASGRVEDAVTQFRAAVTILPSQAASIGLAHALERSGEREAARAQLAALTPPPGAAPPRCDEGCDPWQQYDVVDVAGIGKLVAEFAARVCEVR